MGGNKLEGPNTQNGLLLQSVTHAWSRQAPSTVTTFGASNMKEVGSEIERVRVQNILEVQIIVPSQHVHCK